MSLPRHAMLEHFDLPRPGFGMGGQRRSMAHWTVARKEAVVLAVQRGQITLSRARADYGLSMDEFMSWAYAFDRFGRRGLRAIKGLAEVRPGTHYRVPYTGEGRRCL